MAITTPLTDEERQAIDAAMPSIRRNSPDAARIISRLVRLAAAPPAAPARAHASVTEVARAFDVTPQTIRNWVDRGWLPAERTPGGTRRIPRSVLASAEALAGPRPKVPALTPAQVEAILRAPRRAR
jgi:excisionase family DNA binding protein